MVVHVMTSWHDQAACLGMDTDLFFTKGGTHEAQEAIAVCCQCPVASECLEYELAHEHRELSTRFGIWGGMTPPQRHAIARARARKRRTSE